MRVIRPSAHSDVPRFRPVDKHRRAVVVSTVLAALAGIGAGAWAFGINADTTATGGCVRSEYIAPPIRPSLINVFNSTQQAGLAGDVAQQLRDRGFAVGAIGNDPLRRKIRGTGELRGGPGGEDQILALQSWEAGMNVIRESRRSGDEVDFVIGERFAGLPTAPEAPPWIDRPCVPRPAGVEPAAETTP